MALRVDNPPGSIVVDNHGPTPRRTFTGPQLEDRSTSGGSCLDMPICSVGERLFTGLDQRVWQLADIDISKIAPT
ncbi:hypothetical protein [Actinomyces procaprae]|uniref:hypothetical protein n=1 Tax=Actinomyces procaprae TaxID=2560010 RepID=UPI00109DDBFE|nr:hypothetical protein [Actinomyces procaprae]